MTPRLGLLLALVLLFSAAGVGGQGRRPVPRPQAGPAPPPAAQLPKPTAAQPHQPPAPYFRGDHPYIAPPAPPPPWPGAKGAAPAIPAVTEGELLVLLRPEAPPKVPEEIAKAYRLRVKNRYRLLLGLLVVYAVPQRREALDIIDLVKLERWVLIAQENQRFQLVGRDPPRFEGLQYAPYRTGVEQARRWASGRGVTVALIDTGVDRDHRALRGKVMEQLDLLGAVSDPGVHGTALAGIIAAEEGMQGAAPGVRLLVLRAFHSTPARPLVGIGTSEGIARALDIAVRRRAKVVNLSFGGPQDELIALSVRHAIGTGITLVAAAGNGGPNARPSFPAAFAGVIAVTATDHEDRLYPAASRGRYITVAAPGVEIFTTAPGDRYHFLSGTSMAAAHVTGVVALLLEVSPGLGPREVKGALERSAVDLGPAGPDADFGAGRIDALKVLKYRTGAAATGD